MRPNTLLIALFIVAGMVTTWGQASSEQRLSEALAAQRKTYEDAIARAQVDAQRAFAETLKSLEARAAEGRHYDLASRFQSERATILSEIESFEANAHHQPEKGAIRLLPKDAALTGTVTFKDTTLQRWRHDKCVATWNQRGFHPGHYEVVVVYSCSKETIDGTDASGQAIKQHAGGQFAFGEKSRLVGEARAPLTHTLEVTEDWESFREARIGRMTIKNTAPTFELTVRETKPLDLMHLREIRLVPSATRAEDTSSQEIPDVAELRQAFEKHFHREMEKTIQRQREQLKALRKQAHAAGNDALGRRLDEAIEKLGNAATLR